MGAPPPRLPPSGAVLSDGVTVAGPAAEVPRLTVTCDKSLSNRQVLPYVALAAAASAVLYALAGHALTAPWVVPDELIYSELAKSLADGSLPAIRGQVTFGYGLVQAIVIAPAWALFDDPGNAYVAAKLIEAAVMSLVAFPAFFLARRFVSAVSAAAVAVLSAFVPSMLLSSTLLIEPVLYPVFVTAVLAMVTALQAPTRGNQLLLILAIVLGCLTKPLSIVLAPAYVLAVVQLALLDRRRRGSPFRAGVRAHSTAFVSLGAIAATAVVVPAFRGDPGAALGIYGVVLGHVDPVGTIVWFVRHLAAIDLYVGLLPFAATLALLVTAFGRRGDRRLDEFAATAVWTVGGTLAVVAAYASEPLAGADGYLPTEARLHERNVFALVPLLLVGLALYLEQRRPGSGRLRFGTVAIAVALPVTLPVARLVESANYQAIAVIPWSVGGLAPYWPVTLVPLAAVVVWVTASPTSKAPRRSWMVVAVAFLCTTVAAFASISHPDSGGRSTAEIGFDARWVDHGVPRGSDVLALWVSPAHDTDLGKEYRVIWMSEFFNRTVGTVVEVGAPMPYDLPHVVGSIDDGVLLDADGASIAARYVLAPCRVVVAGRIVASDRRVDAVVYRVPAGPVHVAPRRRADPPCVPGDGTVEPLR